MKINQPKIRLKALYHSLTDVGLLIDTLQINNTRPCPGCTQRCSCSASRHCNCDCNPQCPQAAAQLSSEKDRYPIEQKVLPLVFALRSMNVCEPCWSCEGHTDSQQRLIKIPQVWFYTDSMCLVRLMDEAIGVFKAKRQVQYTWQIVASYSSRDSLLNAFSIKPDLNIENLNPDIQDRSLLEGLQQDLEVIADQIGDDLLVGCIEYQTHLQKLKDRELIRSHSG
ncbi:MAG: hypothetical protein Q9M92_12270 [Enterobacterales bacterium]|nr:hypothetical protein [Enterobacterales bacterium]